LLERPSAAPAALADALDAEAVRALQELLSEPDAIVDAEQTVEHSVARLRVRQMQERLDEIDREMRLADANEKDALIVEKQSLAREIEALGGRGVSRYGKSRS
jgi:primosomal protein N''